MLSKNIKIYKQENHEHLNSIAKLEAELEELKPEDDSDQADTDSTDDTVTAEAVETATSEEPAAVAEKA